MTWSLTGSSKISHLAAQKVDKSLRKKISILGEMISELKILMVAKTQPVEEQLLLAVEHDDLQVVNERHYSWEAERVVPGLKSNSFTGKEQSQEPWILLDGEAIEPHTQEQLGDELVLQCAQETLSQATSLYEESLYGQSVGTASDEDVTGIDEVSPGTMTELFVLLEDAIDANSSAKGNPEGAYHARSRLYTDLLPGPQSLRPTASTTRSLSIPEPLNMPPTIRPAFVKMAAHFACQNSSTTTTEEQMPPVAQMASPKEQKLESNALRATSFLEVAETSIKRYSRKSKNSSKTHRKSNSKTKATIIGTESYDSLCSAGQYGIVDSTASLKYLSHIEQELQDLSDLGVSPSRQHLLQDLQPHDAVLLPSSRVALVGRLGIGKSYVAAAHVHCLLQCFKNVSILWISEPHLEEDCSAVTKLLRMKPPTNVLDPWQWLIKIIRCIPRRVTGPWLVVIDGVTLGLDENTGLQKLFDLEYGSDGYLLMTTRHISTAQTFIKDGQIFHVDTLNDKDAANLLAVKSPIPKDFQFDMLARALDYDPFVIMQVRTFLEMTDMTVAEFHNQLEIILDEQNWSSDGQFILAARLLSHKHSLGDSAPAGIEASATSTMLSVMRAVLNPSWLIVFDTLQKRYPKAGELLCTVTALGNPRFPQALLSTSDESSATMDLLINQSFLVLRSDEIVVSRLMVIAHRVWLIEHGRMGST